ncbi:MAG TPA: thiolase family protein [Candidatus Paceibacterota bacterium]
MSKKIVIAGSCRTPIGKAGATRGNLSAFSSAQLLSACFSESLKRSGLLSYALSQVIAGNVAQSSDSPNIARVSSLKAGIANDVPAFTVQRNCGSGLQAVVSACQMIKAEEAEVVLAGGTESMSNIPFTLKDARFGCGIKHKQLTDALWEGLTDPVTGELMGKTAENVAVLYGISREDQDEFAFQSHQKAFKASRGGKFRSQIVSLVSGNKTILQDDGINPALTIQMLSLIPQELFFVKGGTVHAGNSCGISDGAASLIVLTEESALAQKIKPEAEIIGYAFVGCSPSYMGMGPYFAINAALLHAGLNDNDIDYFEINEAFAAQVLACRRQLGIPSEKLNVWGGAIALGHPVGATGAILITKMIALLKDTGKKLGVVSMCIGGGQGGAIIIKNYEGGE